MSAAASVLVSFGKLSLLALSSAELWPVRASRLCAICWGPAITNARSQATQRAFVVCHRYRQQRVVLAAFPFAQFLSSLPRADN
ncbi:hypothetical protein AWZ03_004188 [Drosophila navojoa]|uniref:Secreted protein n=1 Tax=Drosophila navojoa TaxID=7232 RepID=A0A484BMQ0_DRONA|nr:hypothetical protein AWZ03_004188 [Drosophila navojoa]